MLIDIQSEVGNILQKNGNTELGRYKIQLYFDSLINPVEKERDSYKEALEEIVTSVKSKHKTDNSNNSLLSSSFLIKNGFKLVEDSSFENFNMPYYVKEGIILLFNTPVTKWNENDFLVGSAEMRCGKYYAVAFRWIKEQKDIIEIYKAVKDKDLGNINDIVKTI